MGKGSANESSKEAHNITIAEAVSGISQKRFSFELNKNANFVRNGSVMNTTVKNQKKEII